MNFKETTDILVQYGITLSEIGEALGIAAQTVRQTRLDPETDGFRRPPAGWKDRLAELAERHGQNASSDLIGLAFLLRARDVPDFDFVHDGRRFHASCVAGLRQDQPPMWAVTVDGKETSIRFPGHHDDRRKAVRDRIIQEWSREPLSGPDP